MLKTFTILMFVFFTCEAYFQKESNPRYFGYSAVPDFNKSVSTIPDKNYNHKLNRSGQLVDSACLDCITSSAINSGLVVCMPFNGDASDLAGMNNNGTVIGATLTSDRLGNANSAYSFNGTSDYINATITPDLLTNEYTYSAWVKFNALPPPASFLSFISIGGDVMDQTIGYRNLPGITGLTAGSYNDQGGASGAQSTIVPVIGDWYHIASTRDNTSIKLYINGILTVSSATGANAGYDPVSTFHVGARCGLSPPFSDYGIDGIIDDIRIYQRVLDANEINQIYSSVNCNNTIHQGICKSSFGFRNIDNSRVSIQANSAGALHQLYDTSGFTWEAWFKLSGPIINTSSIISTEDSIYCQDIFLGFGRGGTANALSFMVSENGPDCNTASIESLQTIDPGTWYHVAAVCDYGNAVLKLYLDGNLLTTGVIPAGILNNRLSNDRLTQIGNHSSYYPNAIDGSIDEVRFWNTVRTQTEIQNAMNQCLIVPQNGLVAYFKADENMFLTANSSENGNFTGLLENATWSTQVPAISCSSLTIIDSLTGCNSYNFYGLISNVNTNAITNWQWYFGDGGTATTQNTSHAYSAVGTYTVKLVVTDSNGCKDSTTKNIVGSFQMVPASDTVICAGNSVTLSVNVVQSVNDTILPPDSQFEYTFNEPAAGWTTTIGGWTSGNAPFGNVSGGDFGYSTYWPAGIDSSSQLFVRRNINLVGYDLSTIHWYLGVDNGFVLYINGIPVDSAYAEGYTDRWEYSGIIPAILLNAGNNIIAIGLTDNGEATAFDMMITGDRINSGVSVLWSTGDTTTTINVTPTQTTTYYATVTNGTNICSDSIKVTVKSSSAQTINAVICQGKNYLGYTVSGTYVDTLIAVNGCDSIRTINLTVKPKSVSTITQSICPGQNIEGYTNSGTYIDTLVAANGCDSIRTIKLTLIPKPAPDLGIDKDLCPGDSLVLYPGQFSSYQWQDGSAQNRITIKRPGFYSVVVTNNCGTAKDEILIKEMICDVWFPSAFTPNNDGKNDLFKVLGAHNLSDFQLVVYNRWGQKIFETNDYTKGWPGTINGKEQNSGVFVWYCEFKKSGNPDKTKMQGTVVLIR